MTMLFEGYPDPPQPEPLPELSADRRRTIRQREDIERGVHPLTKLPLLTGDHTCGDCANRVLVGHRGGTYPKCEKTAWAHSAANDCRAWWPACTKWEPVTE